MPEVDGIRMTVADTEPSMVYERGILVHHGAATVTVDVAQLANRSRRARVDEIIGEHRRR